MRIQRFALLTTTLMAACGGENPTPPPPLPPAGPFPAATVVVTPSTASLAAVGATTKLVATARDANGNELTGKTFAWATQAGGVATVDETGLVTAVGNGQALITATLDGATGSAAVRVSQTTTSVVVTPPTATLAAINAEVQLSAVARDANAHPISGKTIAWSSSNNAIATVSSTGLVSAVANGSASITATADGIAATVPITVDQVGVRLSYTAQPTGRKIGLAITPAIEVTILDVNGFRVVDATDPITLSIANNPSGAGLVGDLTTAASGGVARFANVALNRRGVGYTLAASSGSLTATTSASFAIGACPCAYVTTPRTSSVTVIDVATFAVIGVVPVGAAANPVAVTPDGSRVYVGNELGRSVSVIETATDKVVATINLDYDSPHGIGITPNGAYAYLAHRFTSFNGPVSVIETATNTAIDTIQIRADEPYAVAVSPNGSVVYVTSSWRGSVTVIATATNAPIAEFPVGDRAYHVTFAPDGATAYAIGARGDATFEIIVINATTHRVSAVLPYQAYDVAVSPDGTHLYATGRSEVWVFERTGHTVVATIPVHDSPGLLSRIAFTSDGKLTFRAGGPLLGRGVVSVIDVATRQVVATIPLVTEPAAVAVTP
jgi:YVTN family beta-propeller protein